jgi:outer membrane lipoprotein-sorting protein
MHRRQFLVTIGLASGSLALSRFAAADDLAAILAEITRARSGLQSLVASFTQERTIGLLATVVKSEGEMTLVRPDRLRWELRPPDAITYWITPEGFAFATAASGASAGKGGAGRFGAVLSDLLILLGGDLEKLRARYDLTASRLPEGITLFARPKAEDVAKYVKQLELGVGVEVWSVRKIVIEEKNGDRSVITFGKITRDAKVDPDKMHPPRKR